MKRQTSSRNNKQRVFGIETMEKRELFSADALVGFEPVDRTVTPAQLPAVEIQEFDNINLVLCNQATSQLHANGTLEITGSICNDELEVRLRQNDPARMEVVNHKTGNVATFPAALVTTIDVDLKSGHDKFKVNDANGPVGLGRTIRIHGGTGDDVLVGGRTTDWIYGDAGNDTIYGSDSTDFLFGGDGDDAVFGQGGHDVINGQNGNDRLDGGHGDDRMYGGSGHDRMFGGAGNDYMTGDDGNDFLSGGDGSDRIVGGDGNDWLRGDAGNDTVFGGDGHDYIWGGSGNDYLRGGSGNDRMYGEDGNDLLFGELGNDYLDGGAGFDGGDFGGPGADIVVNIP